MARLRKGIMRKIIFCFHGIAKCRMRVDHIKMWEKCNAREGEVLSWCTVGCSSLSYLLGTFEHVRCHDVGGGGLHSNWNCAFVGFHPI